MSSRNYPGKIVKKFTAVWKYNLQKKFIASDVIELVLRLQKALKE